MSRNNNGNNHDGENLFTEIQHRKISKDKNEEYNNEDNDDNYGNNNSNNNNNNNIGSSAVTATAIPDDLSSLGDNSPMRQAELRRKDRIQKAHQRLRQVILGFMAIIFLTFQLSSINSKSAIQAISKPMDEGGTIQNKTQLQQLRNHHLTQVAYKLSKWYKPVSPNVWCIDGRLKFEQGKRRPMGLCYLKIPRAASSYLAGINQRIARNFAKRQGLTKSCIRHDGHVPGMYYTKRDPLSFLWTFLRDPADRALSRVAHALSKVRGGNTGTTNTTVSAYTIKALQADADPQYGAISAGRGGFQLQYAMLQMIEPGSAWNETDPTTIQNPKQIHANVANVLMGYDFIGIVERMDESLVALQLLLGLDVTDILQFPTKVHTQYERRPVKMKPNTFFCQRGMDPKHLLLPDNDDDHQQDDDSIASATKDTNNHHHHHDDDENNNTNEQNKVSIVQQYLESSKWFAQNYGDYLLYQAASLSLDRTILKIGLPEFSQALKLYRAMKQHAEQSCQPKFPCSDDGKDQSELAERDCYDGDHIGCGYPCLDALTTIITTTTTITTKNNNDDTASGTT